MQIKESEVFGFLGHNGAGKTTAIKCILNLIQPTSGSVSIFGEESTLSRARALVGYLPEQPYFYDHLSVGELVHFYACLAGVPKGARKAQVIAALEQVEMGRYLGWRLGALSKGLTQRVALAQAIVGKPKLLILDEPFSGLDPIGRKQFRELIASLNSSGTTIFMSSHVLSDVEYLCDRVSIMVKGELRGVFEVKDLAKISNDECEVVFEWSSALDALLGGMGARLTKHGATISAVFKSRHEAERALPQALSAGGRLVSFGSLNNALEELFMRVVEQG